MERTRLSFSTGAGAGRKAAPVGEGIVGLVQSREERGVRGGELLSGPGLWQHQLQGEDHAADGGAEGGPHAHGAGGQEELRHGRAHAAPSGPVGPVGALHSLPLSANIWCNSICN